MRISDNLDDSSSSRSFREYEHIRAMGESQARRAREQQERKREQKDSK